MRNGTLVTSAYHFFHRAYWPYSRSAGNMMQQSPAAEKPALPMVHPRHTPHDRHTCAETMLQVRIERGQIHAIVHSVATLLNLDSRHTRITISHSEREGMARRMRVRAPRSSIHRNLALQVTILRMARERT